MLPAALAALLLSSFLPRPVTPSAEHRGAAYLRALEHARAGRPAEALVELRGLEAALPEIADRVVFLRAEAQAALGRTDEALAAWAAVPDDSLLAPRARLARARLAAAGDRAAALEALGPLLLRRGPVDLSKLDHGATALLLAGRLRAAGGDREGARAAWMGCWTEHPMAPEAAECRRAISTLPPPHAAEPSRDDVLRRAEALLDANRNEAALAHLGPLLLKDGPGEGELDPFACRVRLALGRAHRKERAYQRTIEVLRPVATRCADPDERVRALYLLASATSIGGDGDEAIALYRRLAREFPTHPFADDALYFAADLLARAGKTDEAREALVELARDHPDGDYRDEARFRVAWLAKQAGDFDGAIAQLRVIEEERREDAYESARAAYWRARLLAEREGGREEALAVWAELAARLPADYYGLLSRARLASAGDEEPPSRPAPKAAGDPWDPGPLRDDPRLRAGALLLQLGLAREAAEELDAIDLARLREAAAAAPGAVLHVADLLDRAGDHRSAHELLRTLARAALRRPPEGENRRVWEIAYPGAFRAEVERWAPPSGVPPDLVHALMREESALDPLAVSRAGAVGLTQLMLPTAQGIARRLGLGRIGRADLARPELNIRLGARHLGDLLRRFQGSVALALAAYNAGGGAVSRWLAQRADLDLDEFVEEIPVEETRGYVKRVLRSFAAYRLLQDDSQEGWERGLLGKAGRG